MTASAPFPAPASGAESAFRIEKGAPTDEELAALTVVLLTASLRTADDTAGPARRPARWRRLDRAPGHRTPRSWRTERRHTAPDGGGAE